MMPPGVRRMPSGARKRRPLAGDGDLKNPLDNYYYATRFGTRRAERGGAVLHADPLKRNGSTTAPPPLASVFKTDPL
ncbi:hypothetical protein EVAR_36818_1 [Eumeta japonica]|uniref:Uncharacterized protein n=1 Tax=Eumeta variegata TaxID=151549 RepID=A0A4C1WYS7_EUMVA|nr:hypothetical protein EVAR_36818_1 [Eumeta japonica]